MAQKVQVVLTCDLDDDEVPAAQTVTFGYDGYSYAFELCEQHLEEFNEAMQAYIAAARVADGPRRRRAAATPGRTRRSAATSDASSGDIRTWARQNGYEISERGRIPAEIRSAYEEATS
jgi:hypothetical protein